MANILGIDVCKNSLDCYDSLTARSKTFDYTSKGIRELTCFYKKLDIDKIVIESTGAYHNLIHKSLVQKGFSVCIVNPYKARCFAKAAGFLAKTDKVDAKMLCAYAQKIDLHPTPILSKNHQELDDLIHYRDLLKEELQRHKNQLENEKTSILVKKLIKKRIEQLEKDIDILNKRIEELTDTDDDYGVWGVMEQKTLLRDFREVF